MTWDRRADSETHDDKPHTRLTVGCTQNHVISDPEAAVAAQDQFGTRFREFDHNCSQREAVAVCWRSDRQLGCRAGTHFVERRRWSGLCKIEGYIEIDWHK